MAVESVVQKPETRRSLGSRAGWTVIDQAISSLTNAGLTIFVARSVDASAFGAFGVAFVAFTFVIGVTRAMVTDPLVIRFSTAHLGTLRRRAGEGAGASLLGGVAAGLLFAVVGWPLGGQLGVALTALALSLPGILVQDAWRHAFFAMSRPAAAAANDLLCAVVQFGVIAAVIAGGRASVLAFMLTWGLGALAGAVLGAAQLDVRPLPGSAIRWVRTERGLGTRLGLDYLLNMGAYNLAVFAVGAIAGLAAVGSLRAAQTLLGPLQVLFSSLAAFVVPTFARLALNGAHRLLMPSVLISVTASVLAVCWLAVLLLLPTRAGQALLGASWDGARDVLLATGVMTVMVGTAIGAILGLKALGRASTLLRCTVVQAPLVLVLAVAGAVQDGARGAATGVALAHLAGTLVLWFGTRRATAPADHPTHC